MRRRSGIGVAGLREQKGNVPGGCIYNGTRTGPRPGQDPTYTNPIFNMVLRMASYPSPKRCLFLPVVRTSGHLSSPNAMLPKGSHHLTWGVQGQPPKLG